jgi:(p)ppGpp synthase/HD superfamily hydrolase
VICAALLHDVAEDHEQFNADYIEKEFGSRVGSIVRTLTKPDPAGKTREEVNAVYFQRLREADEETKLIKLVDKLDNVRDAVNCPDPAKRRRTAAEARDFYLSLASTLQDAKRREVILEHMNAAITTLETMGAAT